MKKLTFLTRYRSRQAGIKRKWLVCGAVLVYTHHSVSGRFQVRAEAAAAYVPSQPRLAHSLPPSTPRAESKIWKSLKKIVQLARDIARVLRRALYLGLCFSPAVASSPLLLLDSPTVAHIWWDVLRRGIWAAGPCLTKFAQWAATRPDIFPLSVCDRLAELQCNTQPHTWEATQLVLERAFGPRWRELLRLDSQASVGSGLVAQVYRGRLREAEGKGGGDVEVAVKVLHPGVRQALEDDLAMLGLVVRWLEDAACWAEGLLGGGTQHEKQDEHEEQGSVLASVLSLSESVDEFRELMTAQLDLQREGSALARFRRNFGGRKWAGRVVFPEPLDVHSQMLQLHQNQHQHQDQDQVDCGSDSDRRERSRPVRERASDVLVETFQHGMPMTEVLAHRSSSSRAGQQQQQQQQQAGGSDDWPALTEHEERQVAALGMDAILKMIFEDNFIHGDLHPGNMLLVRRPDRKMKGEDKFQLVLLDAGICSELDTRDRANFLELFSAVLADDGAGVARLMIDRSRHHSLPGGGGPTRLRPVRQPEFEAQMQALVHEVRAQGLLLGRTGGVGGVSGLLRRVLGLCCEHRVKLDPHFVSVLLSVAVIEGLGRRLDPDIDLLVRAGPFIARAAAKAALSAVTSSA